MADDTNKNAPERPSATSPASPASGKKKPYEPPKILYREELEAMAAVCVPPGKGDPGACPIGPISS
jgi:hypothetical protein